MSHPQRMQKVMTQPINLIFRFLQNKARVQIWLYEQVNMRIEGRIIVCNIIIFLYDISSHINIIHYY